LTIFSYVLAILFQSALSRFTTHHFSRSPRTPRRRTPTQPLVGPSRHSPFRGCSTLSVVRPYRLPARNSRWSAGTRAHPSRAALTLLRNRSSGSYARHAVSFPFALYVKDRGCCTLWALAVPMPSPITGYASCAGVSTPVGFGECGPD
jgi:hypothetical protein